MEPKDSIKINSDGLTIWYLDKYGNTTEKSVQLKLLSKNIHVGIDFDFETVEPPDYWVKYTQNEIYTVNVEPAPAVRNVDMSDTMGVLREAIPGIDSMVVKYPGEKFEGYFGKEMGLSTAIIELNDTEGWSREMIADWLETLDLDLTIR